MDFEIKLLNSLRAMKPRLFKETSWDIKNLETGDIAEYRLPSGKRFRFYKMKNGLWGRRI